MMILRESYEVAIMIKLMNDCESDFNGSVDDDDEEEEDKIRKRRV